MIDPYKQEIPISYEILLSEVTALNKKYAKISELSGENFNIFKILKLQSSEVRLHSAFIGELLNPKGSHGQKDIFLKLFTERFKFKNSAFHTSNAKIEIEKHTGRLNEDKTYGGRIDILLTDGFDNQFIIENKIYAGDQEKQLVRYNNYNNNAHLLYLCLFGGTVSDWSAAALIPDEDYKVISYEIDITEWLVDCRKEVANHPTVREGITQYLNLIKHLTGQSINDTMNKELIEMLTSSPERLEAAFGIANNLDSSLAKLLDDLKQSVSEIAVKHDLKCDFNIDISFKDKHSGFYFWKDGWTVASIGFQFQARDKDLIYGIIREKECLDSSDKLTLDIKSKLDYLEGSSSNWWHYYKRINEPYLNWTNHNKEPWLAIMDGSLKNLVNEKVTELLVAIDGVEGI